MGTRLKCLGGGRMHKPHISKTILHCHSNTNALPIHCHSVNQLPIHPHSNQSTITCPLKSSANPPPTLPFHCNSSLPIVRQPISISTSQVNQPLLIGHQLAQRKPILGQSEDECAHNLGTRLLWRTPIVSTGDRFNVTITCQKAN